MVTTNDKLNSVLIKILKDKDSKALALFFLNNKNLKLDSFEYIKLAIKWGSLDAVRLLAANNVPLVDNRSTALHVAASEEKFEILQYLFALNKIDPFIKDEYGKDVLQVARDVLFSGEKSGLEVAADVMLGGGLTLAKIGGYAKPEDVAFGKQDEKRVINIVKEAQDLWKNKCAYPYNIEYFPNLKKSGEVKNYAGVSYSNHDSKTNSAKLWLEISKKHDDQANEVDKLRKEASKMENELFYGVQNNDLTAEKLKEILSKGVAINASNGSRSGYQTTLHIACEQGNVEIAKLLIENGAKSQFLDINGKTAYDIALASNNKDLISCFNPKPVVAKPITANNVVKENQVQNNGPAVSI